jgi:hypothetical protein
VTTYTYASAEIAGVERASRRVAACAARRRASTYACNGDLEYVSPDNSSGREGRADTPKKGCTSVR